MESAEQSTRNLQDRVHVELVKRGHLVSPQSVNPESPLEEATRNIKAVVGSTFEENLGSAGPEVNDRNTKGRIATMIGKLRGMKKAA